MKLQIIIGITVLCLASLAIAEDPYQVGWMAQIGTAVNDLGQSVAVDASGNAADHSGARQVPFGDSGPAIFFVFPTPLS